MPDVLRGAPLVDLLVPQGTSGALPDLETRLELAGGAGWRLHADDGRMEASMIPSMPLRGNLERVWATRQVPLQPGEPLQEAVGIGLEVALATQAPLAAVGVYGVIGWGLVLFEEPKWLYGLCLLEWLYNPQLAADGSVLQEQPDQASAEANLRDKVRLFPRLFTAEATQRFVERIPPGTLQEVEGMQALSMLGPGGSFDPRYWQSFAVQMAMAEVQELAAAKPGGSQQAPGATEAPQPPSPPKPAPKPAAPDDGLTPLQRAREEAKRKAAEAAAAGPVEEEPVEEDTPDGPLVTWRDGDPPVLWIPAERFDDGLLRTVQSGSFEGLSRVEQPAGGLFERWMEGGRHFVTEVPFLSRLFLDNSPLHTAGFEERASGEGAVRWLDCHLPRVGRVRAVRVQEDGGKRIIVGSDREAEPAALLAVASPG